MVTNKEFSEMKKEFLERVSALEKEVYSEVSSPPEPPSLPVDAPPPPPVEAEVSEPVRGVCFRCGHTIKEHTPLKHSCCFVQGCTCRGYTETEPKKRIRFSWRPRK